jgi:hypothetical protein
MIRTALPRTRGWRLRPTTTAAASASTSRPPPPSARRSGRPPPWAARAAGGDTADNVESSTRAGACRSGSRAREFEDVLGVGVESARDRPETRGCPAATGVPSRRCAAGRRSCRRFSIEDRVATIDATGRWPAGADSGSTTTGRGTSGASGCNRPELPATARTGERAGMPAEGGGAVAGGAGGRARAGAATGAGGRVGAGAGPGGTAGGAVTGGGRKSSGSRYPSGSSARRTPR